MKTRLISLAALVLTIGLLISSVTASAQSSKQTQNSKLKTQNSPTHQLTNPPTHQPATYAALWKSVDSLNDQGLPKSALGIVDRIYEKAKQEKNHPHYLKAVIYRIKLHADYREDALLNSIYDVRSEVKTAGKPVAQVLNSILAELYGNYYQQNRYRFRDRSAVSGFREDSIQTWDLASILRKTTETYHLSLSDPDFLQSISIRDYEPILEYPVPETKETEPGAQPWQLRPTLYDFLAWRALDYFTRSEDPEKVPENVFQLQDPAFFGQTGDFVRLNLKKTADGADTSSAVYHAITIFQELSLFHFNDKDPAALIDAELRRFDFVRQEGIIEQKDSLYLAALNRLEEQYRFSPFSADITFAEAQFMADEGENYNPDQPAKNKWSSKKAADLCQSAILNFPFSNGAKNCRILFNRITRTQELQVITENAVIPGKPFLGKLEFKNVNVVNFRIYKADPEPFLEKISRMNKDEQVFYIQNLNPINVWTLALPNDSDYHRHSIEFVIPELSTGFYILLCTGEPTPENPVPAAFTTIFSTVLSYISSPEEDGAMSVFVPDRETGKPLAAVSAEAFMKTYDYASREYKTTKIGDYLSDEQGMIRIPDLPKNNSSRNFFLKLQKKNDLFITRTLFQSPRQQQDERRSLQTFFFTDRAIYRPGQVIYFKGILAEKTGDLYVIKPGTTTTVQFTNVNGQKVAEQTVTTNDYGSFTGSFTAPQGVLTGMMRIFNGSGSVSVDVEEYKRPTFDITFEPLEGNYRLGETITVSGKAEAFAGNAVDGAAVTYRVVRAARFPFWKRWWPDFNSSPETELISGTTKTMADGSFTISFEALPDKSVDPETLPVFSFSVYADVADINGESHSAETAVSVGYASLLLNTNLVEKINLREERVFELHATNLNGQKTPAPVTMILQQLQQPERALRPRLWEMPDLTLLPREEFKQKFPNDPYRDEEKPENWTASATVYEKTMNTASDTLFGFTVSPKKEQQPGEKRPDLLSLEPGVYRMILKATDPYGKAVELINEFTVFDPSAKEPVLKAMNWFVPLKTDCNPGETARFLVGSAEKNVTVFYEIRMKDSLVSRSFLKINEGKTLIEIPVKEEYRGNFSVNFIFALNNRIFQNHAVVKVPYENKTLDIAFSSFRSKLVPGQGEQWTIRIRNAAGKSAAAEFLASMYDASLDEFLPHTWNFSLGRNHFSGGTWATEDAFRINTGNYYPSGGNDGSYRFYEYGSLNWFGTPFSYGYGRRFSRAGGKGAMDKMTTATLEPMAVGGLNGEEKTEEAIGLQEDIVSTAAAEKIKPPHTLQVRRDLRETAFFYPTLLTDSAGDVLVAFTIPESLTKWKFQGFAHTKDLYYGQTEKTLVTQKELMVFPNSPRFVRQGDTVVFSTKVSNLSGRTLSGDVMLELEDGISGKELPLVVGSGQWAAGSPFRCGVGESAVVTWKLFIPVDASLNLLKYRVVAKSGDFSDGEEKTIPVLTNRMLVTETLPLPVNGKGTFDFSFDKLLKTTSDPTLKNYKLTLEFATNPAWYAVQALPVLNDPQYPNADNLFNVFYANSIASHIANSDPKIRQVFESWKQLTPDALLSNLEKNEQLKSAVLEATPWVMEAQSESARKQRIALLFDLNTLGSRLEQSLQKLQKLQSANGGWPWFAGMPESRYITQNIVTGMGHLLHLGIREIRSDQQTWEMLRKAIGYLDGEMVRDYREIQKHSAGKMNENHLGTTAIQYLHARSYFLKELPLADMNKETREAFEYFRNQEVVYWKQNNRHLQGMISLTLNRLGDKTVPAAILRSLSEKALHSPEMGMYWAGPAGYSWYEAPIETQALLIEVYDEVTADQKAVNEMKTWLLKQKQTQDWKTGRATAEACYALLLRGMNLLAENPKTTIKIGEELIDPEKLRDAKSEAGTGYFQVTWDGKQITPAMGKVTVTTTGEGPAWGALYWQYFENLDKITPAQTPLRLTKELFVETNSGKGPVLVPVSSGQRAVGSGQSTVDTPASGIQHPASVNVGDKLKVRITLSVDRNLEYVHMKDMRASAFEPAGQPVSGYRWQDGLGYYQSTTDAATNFFFDYLPKGTYVFEYPLVVNAAGDYSNGITTVQCMYAPEFAAHSEGIRVTTNPVRASKP